jgi:hypothetical protein
MPIKKNQDKAEQSGKHKDGNQANNESQEKSDSEPYVGKSEQKDDQKPVKYDLDERPWPVC